MFTESGDFRAIFLLFQVTVQRGSSHIFQQAALTFPAGSFIAFGN
nr:MAG TPA: hypothetical protein [Caudoviricetes sp.]